MFYFTLKYWLLYTCQCESGGGGQAYDRDSSDHTGNSDGSNSFRHHFEITNGRNIDILGGDSDSES